MVVGICRITLHIEGNDSLKGKRRVVRRVIDRTRNKFNVAIAEVDALDQHRRAVIGFAVVSNEAPHVNSMLDTIGAFVCSTSEAMVLDRSIELIHAGATDRPLQEFVP